MKSARAKDLVDALERSDLAGGCATCPAPSRPGRPTATDFLPKDPVQAMADGAAHRVPLIVGTNAEEGSLFTRFLKLLPTTEPMIEMLLADTDPESREKITSAYPDYPSPSACMRLGGDFAFGTAAWQIAEAHGRHAPTYLYRYDYAPRTLRWSGFGATHATELFAVFDIYRTRFGSAAHRGRRPAAGAAGERRRAVALAAFQPYRRPGAGLAGLYQRSTGRCWCSTTGPGWRSTRTRPAPGMGGIHAGRALADTVRLVGCSPSSNVPPT